MIQKILQTHGGGGRMSRELIEQEILPRFRSPALAALPDAALCPGCPSGLVFSTDSYVVRPLFFAGGNIGHLAVHGTINDIAVSGGRPRWLSLSLILEEGLPLDTLRKVLDSVAEAANLCGVQIVTGDSKVVEHGRADGMYITTSGIGERMSAFNLSPSSMKPGDAVIVSGTIGDHGMAVLAARTALELEAGPVSDTGPVHRLVESMEALAQEVRVMRDPTRGGVAAVMNELIAGTGCGALLHEARLPFAGATRAVAEMMGIDLLQVACEGRMIAIVSEASADAILGIWRALPEGKDSCCIGTIIGGKERVVLETMTGGRRIIDVPEGELLPRIC